MSKCTGAPKARASLQIRRTGKADAMAIFTTKQRAHLRSLTNHLLPVLYVRKEGVTQTFVSLVEALYQLLGDALEVFVERLEHLKPINGSTSSAQTGQRFARLSPRGKSCSCSPHLAAGPRLR